jgi:cell division protein FtsL
MNQRIRPSKAPSKLVPAILLVGIAIVGFTTLMTRLEATREGYRLSALNDEIAHLEDQNRSLRLKVAQLSSHQRLRSRAAGYHLGPPAPGQIVLVP